MAKFTPPSSRDCEECISIGEATDEEVQRVLSGAFIKSHVTSGQLETYRVINEIEQKRLKSLRVLGIWEQLQESERRLKTKVAWCILGAMFLELCVGNMAFYLIGSRAIAVDQWLAKTFIIGMYGQIISITVIVVKSLFPSPKSDVLTELNKMVKKL